LLTRETDGYYEDFGHIAQLAKAFHRPHVHDGGYSAFRGRRFGAPAEDVPPERFVVFSQNHDQVGNRAMGDRMPPQARGLAALCTLFAPFVPLLFMGEEYGETAPFQFFSDHIDPEIARATREGRREEFAAFAAFAREEIPDPQDPATFERSKLTHREDPAVTWLYRELLKLRLELPAGDAEEIEFEEDAGWLRVRRGSLELVANFGPQEIALPCEDGAIRVTTTTHSRLDQPVLRVAPLSGVLLERAAARTGVAA
jgi:maltooligosyltrehalose trehalohydrolase